MNHKYKEFAMQKSAGEKDAGTISGYFSTYDREPDSYGDIIAPGAFTETIKNREASGHPFPLCWNHDLNQIIGKVDAIEDTEKGPLMTASFLILRLRRKSARSSRAAWCTSSVSPMTSWRGRDRLKKKKKPASQMFLQSLTFFEVSIVPIPANQNAVMTDIKSGRRNKKTDEEKIRQIISLANQLLDDEVDDADDPDDGKDDAKANTAVEEPEQSNPAKDNLLTYIKNMED